MRTTARTVGRTGGIDQPLTSLMSNQRSLNGLPVELGGWAGVVNRAEATANLRARPEDLSVYDLYLRSQQIIDTNPPESIEDAIGLLRRAVGADPEFARGWTALAGAYLWMYSFDNSKTSAIETALKSVARAIDLNPLDADSHAILAEILGFQGKTARSKAEFDIARRAQSWCCRQRLERCLMVRKSRGRRKGG